MRARSDKTEIRYLRTTLRNAVDLLAGVLAATEVQQESINYARRIILEALAPKLRRRARSGR